MLKFHLEILCCFMSSFFSEEKKIEIPPPVTDYICHLIFEVHNCFVFLNHFFFIGLILCALEAPSM